MGPGLLLWSNSTSWGSRIFLWSEQIGFVVLGGDEKPQYPSMGRGISKDHFIFRMARDAKKGGYHCDEEDSHVNYP